MKTPKLAIAMSYIDDDLVSGAVEYKPIPRKKITHFWKHIVAVAACFCVIIAAAIFLPQNGVTPPLDDTPPINGNSTIGTQSPSITDSIVNNIVVNDVDSVPEMLLPFLGEENHTAMSSGEMFEYYGLDITSRLASDGTFNEINGRYPHGIYTFANSTFDMNHFVYISEDGTKEIEIYIGKTTKCEQYASSLDTDNYVKSKVSETDMYIYRYENTPEICLYSVFEINGCDLVVTTYNVDEQAFISILERLIAN